jgi:signal recognition particle receptor subunit beta
VPHFDAKSGEVVMRIVYDGDPEAGKTTNVVHLTDQVGLQRRGTAESPGTTGRRTEYFDWLDFSGGYVDGKRVRCQLVSVPGQPQLLRRRRYLLETADAVVYVVDSRPDRAQKTRESLEKSRQLVLTLGDSVPVGFLVQANKQDLAGALSAPAMASELALPADIPVLPAVACRGEGVLPAFILAARLATDRVRALLGDGLAHGEQPLHTSPAELYGALQRLELEAASGSGENLLPAGLEGSAEDVFPPVKGRGLLSRADLESAVLSEITSDWAPPGAIELRTAAGFTLHSTDRWCFSEHEAARRLLLELVRRQRAWGELAHPGRALFIAVDPANSAFRVWTLTAPISPFRSWLRERLQRRDTGTIAAYRELLRAFERRALELSCTARLSTLCVTEHGLASVAIDETESTQAEPGELLLSLTEHARNHAAMDADLASWLAGRPELLS